MLNKKYLLYSFNYFFHETDQISIIMNYLRKYFTRYTLNTRIWRTLYRLLVWFSESMTWYFLMRSWVFLQMNMYNSMHFEIKYVFVLNCIWILNIKLKVRLTILHDSWKLFGNNTGLVNNKIYEVNFFFLGGGVSVVNLNTKQYQFLLL